MAAAAHQRAAGDDLVCLTIPEVDSLIWSHNPGLVGAVEIDGRVVKSAAPFHHCGVKVRMGDVTCLQSVERFHLGYGCFIQMGYAIPQDISLHCLDETGALPNGKMRLGDDACNGWG